MLNLSRTGMIDLSQASDIATNIMESFKIKAEDLGTVNDLLAATSTRSNTTIVEMGEAMKMVAPFAHELGGSLRDISAMMSLLANAGIKGTMAGAALRGIFQR